MLHVFLKGTKFMC